MIGAILGDVAGSRFEWHNIKSKDFALFAPGCRATDDSMMTLAIAKAIADCRGDWSRLAQEAVRSMREVGRRFPHAGYGGSFRRWLKSDAPQPYNSWGNGAGMRVSPVAFAAGSLDECLELARTVTAVTHNHPEGIKGGQAVAACTYLALHGASKDEIRAHVREHYYPLDFTIDGIRPAYTFDVSCQGSTPQAIEAFLESADFEDALRTAISIGGDSDTIAAMTGAIAEGFYGVSEELISTARRYCPEDLFLYAEWLETEARG